MRKPIIDPVDGTETKHMVMKRVAKGVKKVRGFRVLAYSGGNTRKARQEAEKIRSKGQRNISNRTYLRSLLFSKMDVPSG